MAYEKKLVHKSQEEQINNYTNGAQTTQAARPTLKAGIEI